MTDAYGIVPGMTTARETYEAEFRWGQHGVGLYANALIDGNSLDTGNTPTYELRPGLLMGQVFATGKYKQYNPLATDGTDVAAGVILEGLRMQDFSGVATDRFYALLVGGAVQASKIINLDLQARQQLSRFTFDDIGGVQGNQWFPFRRFTTKTANYTLVATDNFTLFDNTGAAGEVDLTLPPIANGYMFGLRAQVAQVLKFISNEGGNVVGSTATNTSVSVTAIGGVIWVYSNAAGTKWVVEQHGTQTITAA